jgi:hypothetical protein
MAAPISYSKLQRNQAVVCFNTTFAKARTFIGIRPFFSLFLYLWWLGPLILRTVYPLPEEAQLALLPNIL